MLILNVIGVIVGGFLGLALSIGFYGGIGYLIYRMIRGKKNNPNKLDETKIEDKGGGLILGAKGHGDELMENIVRRIEVNTIPNVVAAKRMISVDKAPKQSFLAVSNKRLRGYELLIGAWDYGERLSVMWYLVLNVPGMRLGKDYVKINGKFRSRKSLFLMPRLWLRKMKGKRQGWVSPENMNMLDKEEQEDFLQLVQQIVEDEVKKMMDGLNLDFSKMDMKSRGFLNIS